MTSKKKKSTTKLTHEKELSFTKKIVIFILCIAEIEVLATYILAFLGKESIAETLSAQIVVTVIGTVIGYFVKSLIENIFKNNEVFKKEESKVKVNTEIIQKIEESNIEDIQDTQDEQEEELCDGETYG